MKRLLLALLAASISTLGAEIPTELTLDDGRGPRLYEVACDMLYCRPTGGTAHVVGSGNLDTPDANALHATKLRDGHLDFDLVLFEKGLERTPSNHRGLSRRIVIEVVAGADREAVATACGAASWNLPHYSANHAILKFAGVGDSLARLETVREHPAVLSASPLLERRNVKRLIPNDARYAWSSSNTNYQWHLNNTGQNGSVTGLDVNITSVWDSYDGEGVTISIVDDGLQVNHPDLAANVNTAIDHDWNDGTPNDPTPTSSQDDHGTACAGVAAARGNNMIGVTGAAPRATLVGLRLIAADTTDAEDAAAIGWMTNQIDISSNSWGQADDGRDFYTAGPLLRAALANGVTSGRGGKGTIYVWAAGNGRDSGDYANYDGYNNAIETISVGAINYKGKQSWYSESGANVLISAPSDADDGEPGITTTTLTANGTYTDSFGGTSSATPLVSGCVALMLEANPNLGWRDVQEILIRSAEKIDAGSTGWSNNGGGFHFHHGYGAGMMDANAAVALATTWKNLPSQQTSSASSGTISVPVPDNNNGGVNRTLSLSGTDLRTEHVELTVDIDHSYRGDLVVKLTSPDGTVSQFTEEHNDSGTNIANYTFMSVRHWGEMSNGTWTVNVADTAPGDTGSIRSLQLTVHGIEPSDGYDAWVAAQFDPADAADPNISGALQDPDVDGRTNLLEYALGGDPLVEDRTGAPEYVTNGSEILRYVADTAKTDITYQVMLSTDLINWTPANSSVVATNGTLQTREISLPNGERYFARLRVTR